MRKFLVSIFVVCSLPGYAQTPPLNLATARIRPVGTLTMPERKAAQMLSEEVQKRTRITWPIIQTMDHGPAPIIFLGTATNLSAAFTDVKLLLANDPNLRKPDGFHIHHITYAGQDQIIVAGTDTRGVLFGVGKLLRSLNMDRDKVKLEAGFKFSSSPFHPLRGHQLGYRPKTNSYDGWNLAMWEQYIRDLVVFGANAVELIPPKSDDAADSPDRKSVV